VSATPEIVSAKGREVLGLAKRVRDITREMRASRGYVVEALALDLLCEAVEAMVLANEDARRSR